MGASCVRWTADTERAFLLALKATGQVVRAAAAIGRGPSVCYQRRERSPAFAAAWAAALAEMERERLEAAQDASGVIIDGATGAIERPANRTRVDGWTQQRQRSFCRALADTGSYAKAAKRIGISRTFVTRLRQRSPAFQEMCDTALLDGGLTLSEAVAIRAIEGVEEPVFQNGKLVGYRRRFSDKLAIKMMEREDGSTVTGSKRGMGKPPTDEEITQALMKKLDKLEEAQKRKRRAAQLAWCEEMERKGLAP